MIALYYTTVLSIGLSVAAVLVGAAAIYIHARWGEGSDHAMFASWALVAVALVAVGVAVMAPVTSMREARKSERGLGDGPRFETEWIDGRPVDGITEMADNFPNVATKCVWDGWRAFVTSNGDHLAIVADEACRYQPTGPS